MLQTDHIRGNVPAETDFNSFLLRDVEAFFSSRGIESPRVTIDLLRNGPTQSGVAYPKYYLWVQVRSFGALTIAGAMRVAAVDRARFDVTNFVSETEIAAHPDNLSAIFPAPLVSAIKSRAATGNPR